MNPKEERAGYVANKHIHTWRANVSEYGDFEAREVDGRLILNWI
jgi:hypothetical protein